MSSRASRSARAWAVDRSKRSVRNSRKPPIPPPGSSPALRVRSNFAVPDGTAVSRATVSGSRGTGSSAIDCQASITWNSGCRESERGGLSASTRWSKGSASCS
ncbi:hypothetical protein SCALM49S_05140 [Streptomyces californicus]